ncbi:MAG: GNAT family N-acetyltransferase [Furfurilactobacillus sp.]|jgi:phosphinothricin acetyltransferase|uniref:GNAT family N-acetyltransferase n=1 Tax=Furfurilactobacillus sp. TaxID=2767911 RepID=UPI00258805D3|nr:GNAT family N-acetyltransferase [Furfurilactobacillus sp.]MCH4012149.1 GNAT family N-acetyltransferase [Furfurilactobacillus sp.]MCH4038041.1 GNAT family N-acetyltransferase [Furfurilactobacillus sp.]MCH4115322.1 GNAT family N-acetyltransferase [Furfurilactobacillus sp.]MCI1339968.1 GNAT family N-acetyltransferase [Furfurilactobacillus sp.]MCI1387382.1 GNAT family N-acetyltransferase [Furfurilactobacillus sp.]
MSLTLTIANQSDLPTIVSIYNQSIPSHAVTADLVPVTIDNGQSWFEAHQPDSYPIWMVKDDDNIIGWVSLSPFYGRGGYAHTTEISIYLDQQTTGHGYGSQVMSLLARQIANFHFTSVVAYIFDSNAASLHLFHKFGYEEWGHLPKIANMAGTPRDLIILGRHY